MKKYFYILGALFAQGSSWREFYLKTDRSYDERSRIAHREVRLLLNSIDLVFQSHGTFSSFVGKPLKPYVIYTDYTVALGLRNVHYKTFFSRYPAEREKRLARERHNYQNAAGIFTYTQVVRQSMINDYGVDPEKVITTGLGVRMEQLAPEDWVKSYDDNRIIFVGHDHAFERKGGPNLLHAFRLVREQITDAELVLVGVRRERNIRQPGVRVMGLIRDRKKLADLLESASVFAMPSLQEPFGNVFVEAMAKKLACVGSRVDGIPEAIVDGETGRLVQPNDPEALATTLIELLLDKDRLRQMGECGYKRVRQNYTWDKVIGQIEEHLQQISSSF
jgi:glycosyltransferase involved in cell wall biosynthesis